MKAWFVIGDQNSRKSTTISALTGAPHIQRSWLVSTGIGQPPIRLFVHPRSLQEYRIHPKPFMQVVADAVAKAAAKGENVEGVMVGLRRNKIGAYREAIYYMDTFYANGWNIMAEATLNGPRVFPIILSIQINNTPTMASNEIAALIRPAWGFP